MDLDEKSSTNFLQDGDSGESGSHDFAHSHMAKTIEPDNFPLSWQPLNADEMQTDKSCSATSSSLTAQPSFLTSNSSRDSDEDSLNEDQSKNDSETKKMEETRKGLKNNIVPTENCIGDGEKDGDSATTFRTTMKSIQAVEESELIKTVNLSGKSLFNRKKNALSNKTKNTSTKNYENGMIESTAVDRGTDISKTGHISELKIKKEIIEDVDEVPDVVNNMEHPIPVSDRNHKEKIEKEKGEVKERKKRKAAKLKSQDPTNAFAYSRKGSYHCWICSQKLTLCLRIKNHIVQKHSRALCAVSGEPSSQAQLLLFCPKSCKYVTSEVESFRQHLTSCKQELVMSEGVDLIEIQNSFISQEYVMLMEKVTSGTIFNFLEEQKKLIETGQKRQLELFETRSPKQARMDQSYKASGDDNDETTNGDHTSAAPKKQHAPDYIRTRATLHLCHVCNVVFMTNQSLQQHIRKEHIEEMQDIAPESEEQAEASDEDNKGGNDSYICNCCQKSFTSKNYLLSHMRIHKELTEKRAFKCDNCGKTFNRSLNLITHMRIHTGEKPFRCHECGRCFSTNSNILMHMRIHTGEKPFKCNECSKSFCRRNDLKTHMRIHTGEKPFKCTECGQSFRTNSNILNHMRTHTGERPYPCNECGKAFSRSGDLIVHKRIHTGERPFKCDECGQCYKTNWNLLLHMRTHTGEKPYKCEDCGRGFLRSGELNVHRRVHTGEKPYKCQECDKDFVRSGDLQVHMRIHTENVIFKCEECDKTFTRNVDLSNHVRLHTGEKPFACEDCGRSFSRSAARNKHQRLSCHAGNKPYKCEMCGKGYTQIDHYHSHMRTHTGEKPFVCSLCDESFSQSGLLKRHMKKHAQEDELYQCCECEEVFSRSSLLDEHMKMHLEGEETE